MKFRFKPEDFFNYYNYIDPAEAMALKANRLLDEHLAKCPVSFGRKGPSGGWVFSEKNIDNPNSTHKAVLFNIEELVKEKCKHQSAKLSASFDGRLNLDKIFCESCGIELMLVEKREAAE